MICELTGMEVSNASHYDGATATAEAVITAINVHRLKRKKIVLSPWVHPRIPGRCPHLHPGHGTEHRGATAGTSPDR
jgi:hypothetical protein